MFKKFSLFLGIFSAALCASAHAANTVVVIPSGSVDKEVTVNPPGDATIYDVQQTFTFSSQDGLDLTGVNAGLAPTGNAAPGDVVVGITFSSNTSGNNQVGTLVPAPTPKTGQTLGLYPGSDGALQEGTAWPSPRFGTAVNGTVLDNLTNLTWLEDAGCLGELEWADADANLDTLVLSLCNANAGSGWRVPNIRELTSLISYNFIGAGGAPVLPTGHPFSNVNVTAPYRTSTSLPTGTPESYNSFGINFADGTVINWVGKSTGVLKPVWAVKNTP